MTGESSPPESFQRFVKEAGPRLKQALIAAFGGELGRDTTAEALCYAWEHWDRIEAMDNPAGYVHRIGRNRALRMKRSQALRARSEWALFSQASSLHEELPMVEPGLPEALGRLSERQRTAAVLVHGFGWSLTEVAELLDVSVGSVQKHAERGLAKLRGALGVPTDA